MTTVERNIFANRAAEARAEAIAEQAEADLRDHLCDLQRHGLRYLREYTDALVGKKTIRRPTPHMHTKLAELIRELVAEAAVTNRRAAADSSHRKVAA